MNAAPLTCSAACLMGAVALLAAARSRRGLRVRALTPHTTYFSALFSAPLMRRRSAQTADREDYSQRAFSTRWRRRSIGWWIAALRFERLPAWGGCGRIVGQAVSSLVVVLAIGFFGGNPGTLLPEGRDLVREPSLWSLLGVALLFQTHLIAVPRGQCLYPLSRSSRAKTLYLGALVDVVLGYLVMLSVVFLVGQGACAINSRVFPWTGFIGIAAMLATALPVAPFVHWGRLSEETRNSRTLQIAMLAYSYILVPVLSRHLWMTKVHDPLQDMITPGNVAFLIGLIVATQVGFYLALRRFYRKSDLIQRGAVFPGNVFAWLQSWRAPAPASPAGRN